MPCCFLNVVRRRADRRYFHHFFSWDYPFFLISERLLDHLGFHIYLDLCSGTSKDWECLVVVHIWLDAWFVHIDRIKSLYMLSHLQVFWVVIVSLCFLLNLESFAFEIDVAPPYRRQLFFFVCFDQFFLWFSNVSVELFQSLWAKHDTYFADLLFFFWLEWDLFLDFVEPLFPGIIKSVELEFPND